LFSKEKDVAFDETETKSSEEVENKKTKPVIKKENKEEAKLFVEEQQQDEEEPQEEPELVEEKKELPVTVIAETKPKQPVTDNSGLELEIKTAENKSAEPEEKTAESNPTKSNYDPILDLRDYKFPSLDLLENHGSEKIVQDPQELENNKIQIINTLKNYDIEIQKIYATVGPTVTLYEIIPAAGVRISRIKNFVITDAGTGVGFYPNDFIEVGGDKGFSMVPIR
jgi:S-DNA-T family DNA segregation ATPase FtsK/SpoIIIE